VEAGARRLIVSGQVGMRSDGTIPDDGAAQIAQGLAEAAQAFADTYWVAWALVVLTLVPALLLPRRREVVPEPSDEQAVAVALH